MKMDNKKLITLGVVVVGSFLVYKFIIKGGNKNNGGGEGGVKPSDGQLSSSQINKMATDLFDAMDGYLTNEETILSVFTKIKTNADFDNLVIAFGTRTISSGAGNVFVSDFTGDLSACLRDELDSSEIAEVNEILAKKGVDRSI